MRDLKHIQTLETAPHVKGADIDPIRWARAVKAPWVIMPNPLPAPHGRAYARVNHSRWIVDCPFCAGAQDASRINPIFWCAECGMSDNDFAPMAVVFPDNADEIERILLLRPNPATRNWDKSETLKDLIEQNRAYGDPIGEDK